jgi:hypothetical protein
MTHDFSCPIDTWTVLRYRGSVLFTQEGVMAASRSKTPEEEIVGMDLGMLINELREREIDVSAVRDSFDPSDNAQFARLQVIAEIVNRKKLNSPSVFVWRCLLLTVGGHPKASFRRYRYKFLVEAIRQIHPADDELREANDVLLRANRLLAATGFPFVYVTAPSP